MRVRLFLLVVAAVLLPGPGAALAGPPQVPLDTWVTDAPVNAVARAGDTIYLGGNFSYAGPNTGSGSLLDDGSGQPTGPRLRINGDVLATAADGICAPRSGVGTGDVGGFPSRRACADVGMRRIVMPNGRGAGS
jgi:hypothetical protein